jgi:hypothetical protein
MTKKHDLKCTYGKFKFVGKVFGVEKQNFYKEMTFDSGSLKRECNFGIETSKGNKLFVKCEGFVPKNNKAVFSKWDATNKKRLIKEVDWDKRKMFKEEGYYPNFGVKVGLETDEKGHLTNYISHFGYDACEEIQMNLVDDMSVIIEGKVNYSSYVKNGEKKQYVNYLVEKIYVLKNDIDFDAENFKEENKFQQTIVYTGIEKHPTADGEFLLNAKIITSDGVEDVEYIIKSNKVANPVKKNLKPYNAIDVLCRVTSIAKDDEDIEEDDAWGDDEDIDTPTQSYVREIVVTKVYKNSLDKDTYSQEKIDAIKVADEDFGDSIEDDDEDVWE